MRSFNERSGASSSEGGGEFECRVSTYLPSFFFFFLAHNGGKKRKRETGSAIDLTVNLVDYDRCVRLCR